MSRWRYNGEQLAAIDAWIEGWTSVPDAPQIEMVYLPALRGDGSYEALAVILDDERPNQLDIEPLLLVCFLVVAADGKITQTDGAIEWKDEG